MKTYAGLGDLQTPEYIIEVIRTTAILLVHDGFMCITGGCQGAEQAFANGTLVAGGSVKIHLPWPSFEAQWIAKLPKERAQIIVLQDDDTDAYNSVKTFHPAYEKLTPSVRAINARYFNILNNVSFLICWTNEGKLIGSTGQAMRLATYLHVPIYNLGIKETLDKMVTKIQQRSDELIPYRSISSGIF